MSKTKVSSKGQIVIPKEIRERLGIKPGTILNVKVEGSRIILEPTSEPPEIFVELGERSEEILQELRKESEERIKRLLRDLGVEGSN